MVRVSAGASGVGRLFVCIPAHERRRFGDGVGVDEVFVEVVAVDGYRFDRFPMQLLRAGIKGDAVEAAEDGVDGGEAGEFAAGFVVELLDVDVGDERPVGEFDGVAGGEDERQRLAGREAAFEQFRPRPSKS